MTPADLRGLTPIIYHHVSPYGLFTLDMSTATAGGVKQDADSVQRLLELRRTLGARRHAPQAAKTDDLRLSAVKH